MKVCSVSFFYDLVNAFGSMLHASLGHAVDVVANPRNVDLLKATHANAVWTLSVDHDHTVAVVPGVGDAQGSVVAPQKLVLAVYHLFSQLFHANRLIVASRYLDAWNPVRRIGRILVMLLLLMMLLRFFLFEFCSSP